MPPKGCDAPPGLRDDFADSVVRTGDRGKSAQDERNDYATHKQ